MNRTIGRTLTTAVLATLGTILLAGPAIASSHGELVHENPRTTATAASIGPDGIEWPDD
ncbi:hypothetical protein [Streptomyces sp. NRRL WC-3742]|uniref:hypothetical protein n=1 Tax=Streptomyces sp. NRRL WC-3742 TaxID=1463934 RepID=UPI000A9629C5|nr:hypothetical protein [Streptomyces sp. NRRL WC-3742]